MELVEGEVGGMMMGMCRLKMMTLTIIVVLLTLLDCLLCVFCFLCLRVRLFCVFL